LLLTAQEEGTFESSGQLTTESLVALVGGKEAAVNLMG
jgi:hypothetical protein